MAPKKKKPKKRATAEKNKIRAEKFERKLRVILTREEIEERADRAAHLLGERDAKEELAKAAQKHAKSEIEEIEAQMRRISGEVRDKSTYREIKCERRFDFESKKVIEFRLDTDEEIERRDMTAEELQMGLDFDGAPDDKPDPDGGGDVDDDFAEGDDKAAE